MATWKKVIVSGSNISQLSNDSGYLTSTTVNHPNGFATASFSGTNLLADSPSGSLNFASSSGQGLTISANAGNDTLTFGLSSIPNSSLASSSIGGIALGGDFNTLTAGTGLSGGIYDPGLLGVTFAVAGAATLSTNAVTKWNGSAFANSTITDNGSVITTTTPLSVTGNITATGNLIVSGNTTLGDASADSVTVNAQTLSLANQLTASALSSTMLVITSSNRVATQTLGTGIATALGINVGSAGAPVLFNGAGGTPASITLTNGTGLPISTGVSGLGTGIATFLATPSSTNLAAAVTDETGTGTLVFSVSPTFTGTVGAAAITTTGNVTVGGNATITGDLTVNGTTTIINTDNLSIEDKFIVLGRAVGGTAPAAEGGIIVEGAGGSGSAFVFNSGSGAGVSNRWGIALSVATGSADVTPTDFMVSAIQASGAPSAAPTYGGSNGGFGNIYVNSSDESIWIYS